MCGRRKWLVGALCFLFLTGWVLHLFFGNLDASAQEQFGQVTLTDGYLNVRDGAGTEYRIIDALYDGELVQLMDSRTSGAGEIWYKVFFVREGIERIGYVHSKYITIVGFEDYEADLAFEDELITKGFPESYFPMLRALHAKYPNWQFTAQHTGLDWDTVIENESELRSNLVPNYDTVKSSWKSTQEGAFDWLANDWVVFSGKASVQASSEIIAHYMDPRNFLNETGIFQFEQLTYNPDVHSAEGVEGILKGTFMENKQAPGSDQTYAQICYSVGKKYGISPYFIASRLRQEQGVKGNSDLISGKYEGFESYYNYFNIGASGSGTAVIENGLSRAMQEGWDTVYKAIEGGALIVSRDYILSGQDTLYLQKFDVDPTSHDMYWHQYMQTLAAPSSEAKSVYNAYASQSLLDEALVFKIPVYDNMPDAACPAPEGDGNPNCKLRTLSVEGYENAFAFSFDKGEYSLTVPNSTSEIVVKGTAIDDGAEVSGTGVRSLHVGLNLLEVTCTAENGDITTYVIHVTRSYPRRVL